ncbi:hypothetical protein PG997_011806 [Apiospora hydei]|uniref:Polyketide synthase n=1 Tax=Apiospora hydei TaxID=1337664 RepID=A0ABR1V4R5_9PEZI
MNEAVAIVGLSYRLPQEAENESGFWELLEQRRNAMTEWPGTRINLETFHDENSNCDGKIRGRGAHFLKQDPSLFDAPFFSSLRRKLQQWTPSIACFSRRPTERLKTVSLASSSCIESSNADTFGNKAGMPVERIKGSQTGVFAASMTDDYTRFTAKDPDGLVSPSLAGVAMSLLPNRVSWYFDLLGPSVHIDTACSGSLVALDMACQSIQSGDSSMALVAGTNLLLGPEGSIMLSHGNYLSPHSVCYSFDERADGYARGEGVIALVIKPVSAAIRDGDTIRAVIRATGSNQDGRTPTLTQPSSDSQERLIRRVYHKAGLGFEDTRFVEAHGTGTAVGDPIEMKAIGKVFREHRSSQEPLYVGSVKSNIGHTEGSAGLAGVAKAVLVLERGIILPNALFERMNPAIDADFYHLAVPTTPTPWPHHGLRRVSVNSFGFGGTNAHAIIDDALHYLQDRRFVANHCTRALDETSEDSSSTPCTESDDGGPSGLDGYDPAPQLLVWTAADETALGQTTQSYVEYCNADGRFTTRKELEKLAYTLSARRSILLWRTFGVISPGGDPLVAAKPTRASGETALAFVFTGQGAQYHGMGLQLMGFSVFKRTLERIDRIIRSIGCDWSLFGISDEMGHADNIHLPEYSQLLCTALQIALVELLRSCGVVPRAVIGHSSGEIAASYTVGAVSLESACKIAYFRGQAAGNLRREASEVPGAMLSANLAETDVAGYVGKISPSELSKQIGIACVNSPVNCTLSGPERAIDVLKQRLEDDGIFSQKLKTGVAYHSPAMESAANEYRLRMGTLMPGDTVEPGYMVSSVLAQALPSPELLCTPQYWVDNLISPVRFSDGLSTLVQGQKDTAGPPITHIVEIGPHSALRRPVQDILSQLKGRRKHIQYRSVLQRSRQALRSTLEFLGQLFCDGYPVDVTAANGRGPHTSGPRPFLVNCPEYPFNHSQAYWIEPRISRDFRLRGSVPTDSLGARCSDWNPLEPRWRKLLSIDTTPWTQDHVVQDAIIYPATGMIVMALEAVKQIGQETRPLSAFFIKEARFLNPITVGKAAEDCTEVLIRLKRVQSQYEKESTWSEVKITTQIQNRWTECFQATIQHQYLEEGASSQVDGGVEKRLWEERIVGRMFEAKGACASSVDSIEFYRGCLDAGMKYGNSFQLLREIGWDGGNLAIGQIASSPEHRKTSSLLHPAVLDNALQILLVQATKGATDSHPACVPSSLSNAWISASGWERGKPSGFPTGPGRAQANSGLEQ